MTNENKTSHRRAKSPETTSQDQLQNYFHLFLQMGRTVGTTDNYKNLNQGRFDEVLKSSLDTLVMSGVLSQETAQSMQQSIARNPQLFRGAFSNQMNYWQEQGVLTRTGFNSDVALRVARNDNAGGGFCARGTHNILTTMGYVSPRGDAHTWDEQLKGNSHWVRLSGVTPQSAPEGAVLFYDRTSANAKGGGAKYGHVEVVVDDGGQRRYVSDAARSNFGGTVPQNFEGAYLYVGPGAPSENLRIAQAQSRDIRDTPSPSLALT
jgi:hypothetical protein